MIFRSLFNTENNEKNFCELIESPYNFVIFFKLFSFLYSYVVFLCSAYAIISNLRLLDRHRNHIRIMTLETRNDMLKILACHFQIKKCLDKTTLEIALAHL